MKFQIRKAETRDIEAIHQLVYDLAVYEKSPQEVVTTPQMYLADFEANRFDAFLAVSEENGEILGLALYYKSYSTWKGPYYWLEDFVVKDTYRGLGIGKQLFETMVSFVRSENTFMKWEVLDWNTPAIHFYDKYKAEYLKEWITCRLR